MMKNKKMLLVILSIIFISLIGFIITLRSNKEENNHVVYNDKNEVISDVSSIIFTNVSDSVNLGDVVPMLDKFGVLNQGFTFSIKNTSSETIPYTLSLMDDKSTFLNKMVRYELVKNNSNLGIHSLNDDGIIDIDQIMEGEEIHYSLKMWLDYNSNVKMGTLNKKILVSEGINYFDDDNVNKPELIEGMIPVYYDYENNSFFKSDTENSFYGTWYNYSKGIWANAVTVNSDKREEYLNSQPGTRISLKDINSIWVWVPRFQEDGEDIKFVSLNDLAHSAFTFNNQNLSGVWVSKFEAGLDDSDECIKSSLTGLCNNSNKALLFKPNVTTTNRISIVNLFYAIRKMELKDNIYGFKSGSINLNNDGTISNDDNNYDIHLIRNNEWEMLSILSKSQYGSENINPNNTSRTGMAFVNNKDYNFDISGYGDTASINNNVTGIYDLVGGNCEYVMMNIPDNETYKGSFLEGIKDYYYSSGNDINVSFPPSRGGYQNTNSDIASFCKVNDYVNNVSLQTNTRAVLSIFMEDKIEKEKES